ncbi:hypothetical protein I4U23_001677 [Adineta vaga]|nr:hypothetical protein I4U23_001677 [Adineta vaga]
MNACRLDRLPVELIHQLFNYFSAHEICYTFLNVTSYLDAIVHSYSAYQVDFQSISRTNFDLVCQHIIPDQVTGLTLSDDENTPGLVQLFLSHFEINQFKHLRLLRLVDIGPDFWECIMTQISKLKNLRTFLYVSPNRSDSWISEISARELTKLDKYLAEIYAPILPQLYRLRLSHGDYLESIEFPCLRHLILIRSTAVVVKHICSVAPQLVSFESSFPYDSSYPDIIYPLPQLKQLILKITDSNLSINNIERLMTNLPRLKHLKLTANCQRDVVDGHRLQMIAKDLVNFKFLFRLTTPIESDDLDSFRTSFWLKEKGWFVAGENGRLFSVPDFNKEVLYENFPLPICSTISDDTFFYNLTETLYLLNDIRSFNHYFTHIKTLSLVDCWTLSIIEKTLHLQTIECLIISLTSNDFPLMKFIDKMPNLYHISISNGIEYLFDCIRSRVLENIRKLEITCYDTNINNNNIKELSIAFPNIEHLHVKRRCSTKLTVNFLDRFKRLSTASFQYMPNFWFIFDDQEREYNDECTSVEDLEQCLQQLHYTCRLSDTTIYIWI